MLLQQKERGFTLLEILVFMGIFAVVMTGAYMMYFTQHTTFTRGKAKIDVNQHARVALETLAREIRMAGFDPSGAIPLQGTLVPAQPASAVQVAINTLNNSQIRFIADVDGDNISDQVLYQFQDNAAPQPDQIIRTFRTWQAGGWSDPATVSALADNATGLSLTFMDGASAETGILANIRMITIRVNIAEAAGQSTEAIRVDTNVRLRNLLP